MKVHEKTTYSSRVNAKTAAMRKIGEESDDEEVEEKKDKDGAIAVKDDPPVYSGHYKRFVSHLDLFDRFGCVLGFSELKAH